MRDSMEEEKFDKKKYKNYTFIRQCSYIQDKSTELKETTMVKDLLKTKRITNNNKFL